MSTVKYQPLNTNISISSDVTPPASIQFSDCLHYAWGLSAELDHQYPGTSMPSGVDYGVTANAVKLLVQVTP